MPTSHEEKITEQKLLAKNLKYYEDKWVAVKGAEVMISAYTLSELLIFLDILDLHNEIESCFRVLPANTICVY